MTHTSANAVRAGLLAAALLAACAVPAQATARSTATDTWFLLTVTRGENRADETHLRCDPPRGHARAADACAELAAVDGDITRIPPKNMYCPMFYAPVTAHARGQWHGRPVTYTQTFSNACLMAARTGSVFALGT